MPFDPDDDLDSADERVVERLLDAFAAGDPVDSLSAGAPRAVLSAGVPPDALPADPPEGNGSDELLARLYTELLGALPLALEERAPPPGLRERVLAEAVGSEGGGSGAADGALPAPGSDSLRRPSRPRRGLTPRWLLPAAAALTLALVGLGLVAGWLHGRLDAQERTVADLRSSLEETERRAAALAAAQDEIERRRLDLASQLALVSTPGVEVCPLRPMGETATDALGLLFLSNSQREWYVRVARLDQPEPGMVYVLWFRMGTDRYVAGGVLEPGADDTVQLSGTEMPTREEMTGAAITLERAGEGRARPTGPVVLFGDERVGMV